MNTTLNWYILYTKHQTEIKLTQALDRKGYETFCPQFGGTQKCEQIEKEHSATLFSSWVFLRCSVEQLNMIKQQYRTVKVIYRLDKPAVVSEEEISLIRYVINRYSEVKALKTGIGLLHNEPNTTGKASSFSLPSLGFALLVQEENVILEAFQPAFEDSAGSPPDFVKRGWNKLGLLKKIPSLLTGKLLKPTS